MATFNKFNIFVQDLGRGVHNLNSNALKVFLTNTSPNAADTVFDTTTSPPQLKSTSNAPEVVAASAPGYTAGGATVGSTAYSQSAGTGALTGSNVVWTASGDWSVAFQYVGLYNNGGATSATRPVISYYNYGSSITPKSGETFTVDFTTNTNILTIA